MSHHRIAHRKRVRPRQHEGSGAACGDAVSWGSATNVDALITDAVATPSGNGYYMVGINGRVYTFGDAVHRGDESGVRLNAGIRSILPTSTNSGYWLIADDGGV